MFLWNRNVIAQTIPHPVAGEVHSLLSTHSEKWTSVVHGYCLLLVRKLDSNCSLLHDEDIKSIHNSTSRDVLCVLSEAEYSGKTGDLILDSKRKLSEQHRLEGS